MGKQALTVTLAEDNHLGRAGQRVNLELTQADVHDPTEIPTYLAGYKPWEFRADEASPALLVDNDQDKFRSFSEGDAFEPVNVKQATTAAIPEVDPRTSLSQYKVVDRFIGSFVSWVTEHQRGNNYQPRMAAARRCSRAVLLDRELDILGPTGLLTTIGNWDTTVRSTLTSGFEWLNTSTHEAGVNSDPIKDIQTAVELSHQPVSFVMLNQRMANAMIRHPKVKDHMRQLLGDQPASAIATSLQMSATTAGKSVDILIPGLPPILVSQSKYKTPSGSLSYVMPDVGILLTVPPAQPMDGEEIATSYTFRRRGPAGTGFESREFIVEGRGPYGGTMVVVSMADVGIMTGNNCGGIISGLSAA